MATAAGSEHKPKSTGVLVLVRRQYLFSTIVSNPFWGSFSSFVYIFVYKKNTPVSKRGLIEGIMRDPGKL